MTETAWQFCTHLVPLARALSDTTGDVLEIGMGDASTPFLSWYMWSAQRRLVSVDNHAEWVERFKGMPHGERRVVDYHEDLPRLATEHWSMVLVDHWPGGARVDVARLFRRTAEIVLIHDFDQLQDHLRPLMAEWPMHEVCNDTLVLMA